MIPIQWREPCTCNACLVAGVSRRNRPARPELHGRDLLLWLEAYEKARDAWKALPRRTMRPAIVQTDPHGRPLED
jgi:hypothetical protein